MPSPVVNRLSEESTLARDYAADHFIGEQIGSGAYRRVYALRCDPKCVIKIEHAGHEFCNINEMQVWRQVKDTPIEDWFAPCEQIDEIGLTLIQRRTIPFQCEKEFKEAINLYRDGVIPDFFDDVHHGNFGMMDGLPVCHDYGFNHFLRNGVEKGWRKLQEDSDGQYSFRL